MPEQIGVISDTHGLVRPEALAALAGVSRIVHAGDVGGPEVIEQLASIAPVTAVRGNNDRDAFGASLPHREIVEIGTKLLYLVHEIDDLDLDPAAAGISAVVFGHSHRPQIEERGGVLYVNPGSAGPRRFRLPVSVATLTIGEAHLHAEILPLSV